MRQRDDSGVAQGLAQQSKFKVLLGRLRGGPRELYVIVPSGSGKSSWCRIMWRPESTPKVQHNSATGY